MGVFILGTSGGIRVVVFPSISEAYFILTGLHNKEIHVAIKLAANHAVASLVLSISC